MSKGGSKTQTIPVSSTTRAEPPAWIERPLQTGISGLSDWYANAAPNANFQHGLSEAGTIAYGQFGGGRYAPFRAEYDRVAQGDYLPAYGGPEMGSRNVVDDILSGRGNWGRSSAATGTALSDLANLGGSYGINAGPSLDYLQDAAEGKYLYGGPQFNRAFDAASNRITPAVQSAFNTANRMGGGAGQLELTRELGDAFAGLYGQERGLQADAANRVMGHRESALDRSLAASRDLSNIYQSSLDRQLGAANTTYGQYLDQYGRERDRGLSAMGLYPTIAAEEYRPSNVMRDIGMASDLYDRGVLSDYLNLLTVPSKYYQNSSTTGDQVVQSQKSNTLGTVLGAGLSLASIPAGGGFLGGLLGF